MADSTGGHHLDTGDGPTPIDPVEPLPSERDTAWRTYVQHRLDCTQCRTSVFRCAEGDALWNGYRDGGS